MYPMMSYFVSIKIVFMCMYAFGDIWIYVYIYFCMYMYFGFGDISPFII